MTSEVKGLKTQASNLESELKAKREQLKTIQKEINTQERRKREISKKILELESKKDLRVSEHALLRYVERVKGIDLAEIEKEILDEDLSKWTEKLGGNGQYPHQKGYQRVLVNYTVTTILT